MVELAIADDSRFAASRIEIDRDGPSCTADTLAAMTKAEPDREQFLILGGDQAAALPDGTKARRCSSWPPSRWWSGSTGAATPSRSRSPACAARMRCATSTCR